MKADRCPSEENCDRILALNVESFFNKHNSECLSAGGLRETNAHIIVRLGEATNYLPADVCMDQLRAL